MRSECQARPTREATSPPKYSDMPSADVILQSSDLVHFRVHKSALIASSPFFGDMFSLPQPPDDAAPDGLPVVHLSEDAEVLNSLISMLYSVAPEIPHSSDNILALLAAAAKYDMGAAQSSIRAEVCRKGLLSSTAAGVFRVYAVACNKGLLPEAEAAARLTLGYPLTFESLGDALRSFEGWALRDLAEFRLRSIHDLCSNWNSFLDCVVGPSKIWVGCPAESIDHNNRRLPTWLHDCLQLGLTKPSDWNPWVRLKPADSGQFTETLPTSVELYDEYLKALQSHVKKNDCNFCMKVHILEGEKFYAEMKDVLAQAWNVPIWVSGERTRTSKTVCNL
jgi:BTB/POZ domain